MNIRAIPAGVNFLSVLAEFLRADSAATRTALSDYMVLLPTRRAVRTLQQILSAAAPTLLPRMHAIGDLGDDILTLHQPDIVALPVVNDTARLGLLMELIQSQQQMLWQRAQALATALAKLLDEATLREVSLAGLENLVPQELAQHWGISLEWLRVITQQWPQMLSKRGQTDAAAARQEILNGYGKLWQRKPPAHPIVAAGSTGSLPATRRLLKTITSLPRGMVVLPALDTAMPDEIWDALPLSHPQKPLANLLADFGITRTQISFLVPTPAPHTALWQEVLLPAAATERWRNPNTRLITARDIMDARRPEILKNLSTCTTPDSETEAQGIALILRRAAMEGQTAALVTPDRTLAARVAAQMRRFGITVNDSAGASLDQSPPGRWIRLLLMCLNDGARTVSLLSLLKHPLSCFGETRATCRAAARTIERNYFRADAAPQNVSQLLSRAAEDLPLRKYLELLQPAATPQPLSDWMKDLRALAGSLTSEPDSEPLLWDQDAGEKLWQLFLQLETYSDYFPALSVDAVAALLEDRMRALALHPHDAHPRLQILGPLEARLHGFDVVVLGGLNEGTWPAEPAPDPWLSRLMREEMGLAVPDEILGLAAHDFYQLATQPRVILTRAEFMGGAPTVPSAWWRRLSAYIQACGGDENLLEDRVLLAAAAQLDAAPMLHPAPQPMPQPDAAHRPRRYSPSSLETLMRNPYEFYAKYILNLRALPALGEAADETDQGNFLHAVFADFTRQYPDRLPPDSVPLLDGIAGQYLERMALGATDQSFWQQNFHRARTNFLTWQKKILDEGRRVLGVEHSLLGLLETGMGPVELTARADRIDVNASGEWIVVDYKRKNAPTENEVLKFIKPQLAMEGWLLQQTGLPGYPTHAVGGAEFWPLLEDEPVQINSEKFSESLAVFPKRLAEFLGFYLQPDHAFTARALDPDKIFDDQAAYVRLSRAEEWEGEERRGAA